MAGGGGTVPMMNIEDPTVQFLLAQIPELKKQVAGQTKNGAGAVFPPSADDQGYRYYLLADTHVRSGTAQIVCGSKSMLAQLKHGATITEPGVQRFREIGGALIVFFETYGKRYMVTVRR